jgi:hypothetical protein
MKWLEKYRFGFDIWGLLLFLLIMFPNFIWFAVPAPNDVLRMDSTTPIIDTIASVCQVLMVACLCFIINKDRNKLRFSPWVIAATICVPVYYIGWALYYTGIANDSIIFMLTIPPCLAFILFATDRKNPPAVLFAIGFALCHFSFAIVNYLI